MNHECDGCGEQMVCRTIILGEIGDGNVINVHICDECAGTLQATSEQPTLAGIFKEFAVKQLRRVLG